MSEKLKIQSFSWTILDENTAVKKTDMSVFKNFGSGIPIEIRFFFKIENFKAGDRKKVTLVMNGKEYDARLEKIRSTANQARIMWKSDLKKELNRYCPGVLESKNYPDIEFKRISEDRYELKILNFVPEIPEEDGREDYLETETYIGRGEGRKIAYYTTKYERSKANREKAVHKHGFKCIACGFDFYEVYGERGKNFIEVHHIKPLFSLDEEVTIDPKTDLVCLCSNCHRMIHRNKKEILTVEELKKIIEEKSS